MMHRHGHIRIHLKYRPNRAMGAAMIRTKNLIAFFTYNVTFDGAR